MNKVRFLLLATAAALALLASSGQADFPVVLRILNTPNFQANALFGDPLAMGDVNGDGRADLLAGAPFEDVGANADQGRAYLFDGGTGALLQTFDTPNPQANASFGASLALGDVDGDGRADLLAGAPNEDVGANADQGGVYLFDGGTGALLQTLDSPNPQFTGRFGSSVAMGDADGDRRADPLVGAPDEDVGANADQGRAYLFTALGAVITLDSPNPQANARFGLSLATADASGDGNADPLGGRLR